MVGTEQWRLGCMCMGLLYGTVSNGEALTFTKCGQN
jgi:hypothetical protein